jgi:outer membrane protein TolC
MKAAHLSTTAVLAGMMLVSFFAIAQQPVANVPAQPAPATDTQPASPSLSENLQKTEQTTTLPSEERAKGLGQPTFWKTWSAHEVEPLSLRNSERLHSLIVNGTLYLSLRDMILLTVENNLDVEVQRYQLSIADTDVLRAKGGGITRGLPLTIQQAPVGIGGPGGTLLNQAAAAGAVSPTPSTVTNVFDVNQLAEAQTSLSVQGNIAFSTGPAVPVYDPNVTGTVAWVRREPANVSNTSTNGPLVPTDNTLANLFLYQGFSTGLQAQAGVSDTNDINLSNLTYADPFRHPNVILSVSQPLLRGGGFNVNRRYIKISENNMKVSRLVFRQQLVDLIYGVSRLYYDLVSLNEDVQVRKETVAAAQQLYNDDKAQVEVGTLAPLELSRVEALVASAQLDLTRSQGLVQQQEAVVRSMISRIGSADATLQAARVFPTDTIVVPEREAITPVPQLIDQGLSNRADLAQAGLQLKNGQITVDASRNNVRPEIDAIGAIQSHGAIGFTGFTPIGGIPLPPTTTGVSQASVYEAGVQLNLPFRNRIAQADAARDELQLRQMEARVQQLQNQIRDEIENASIAVEVARTAYAAAVRSRIYQEQLLQAEKEKLSVGASTNFFIVQDQSFLAQARSTEVVARSTYIKSRVALQRALGTLLEDSGIQLDDAIRAQLPPSLPPSVPAASPSTNVRP